MKSVLDVAQNGAIVFISKLYLGNTSDVPIVKLCTLLDKVKSRGYDSCRLRVYHPQVVTLICTYICAEGAYMNITPFLSSKSQYNPVKCNYSEKLPYICIYSERANESIKMYEILRHDLHWYKYISTKTFQLCCALVNFQDPLLQKIAENYVADDN